MKEVKIMKRKSSKTIAQKVISVLLAVFMMGIVFNTTGFTVLAAAGHTAIIGDITSSTGAKTTVKYPTDITNRNPITVDDTFYNNHVPLNGTITVNDGGGSKIFLDGASTDGKTNRQHIHVYQAARNMDGTYTQGSQVPDSELSIYNTNTTTVSNGVTSNNGNDTYFNVAFKGGMQYDSTYLLVIEQTFTETNRKNVCNNDMRAQVNIPFKTDSQIAAPTLKTVMITGGSSLHLDGLTMNSQLAYNIAPDGTNYTKWVPFTYTDTSADITLPSSVSASANAKCEVGYMKADGSAPSAVSTPVSITFKQGVPSLTDAILSSSGTMLTLEGLPDNAANLEYNIAADGKTFGSTWADLTVSGTTSTVSVTGLIEGKSVVKVRAKADTVSLVSDTASCTVIGARPSNYATPPSFSFAQLNGNKLTFYGLPITTVALEYNIALDGITYGTWIPLTYTGSTAVVDVTGLAMVEGTTKIQIRYAADNTHIASDSTTCSFSYAVNATIPMTQGQTINVADSGVVINPQTLASGTNTVAVRNAAGEQLINPYPYKGMAGNDEDKIPTCGGTYGITLNQASDASGDDIKVTIPYTLPTSTNEFMENGTTLTDDKVAIYMLSEFYGADYQKATNESWAYWKYMPTTIDPVNHTATIDLKGDMTGKQIVLSVRYDVTVENDNSLRFYARDYNKSITVAVGLKDWSGYKDFTIIRTQEDDLTKIKEIHLSTSDPSLNPVLNSQYNNQTIYYYKDTDVSPGIDYIYQIESATDNLGNISNHTTGSGSYDTAYVDKPEDHGLRIENQILKNMENPQPENGNYFDFSYYGENIKKQAAAGAIWKTPQFVFADGDSQNSVTTAFRLPSTNFVVQSDNTSVLNVACGKSGNNETTFPSNKQTYTTEVQVMPQKDSSGNPISTKVNLQLFFTSSTAHLDSSGNRVSETAVTDFKVPFNVKWKTSDSTVEIGNNKLLASENNGFESMQLYGKDSGDGLGTPDYFFEISPLNELISALGLKSSYKTIQLDSPLAVYDTEGHWGQTALHEYGYIHGDSKNIVIDGQGRTLKLNYNGPLIKFLGAASGGAFTLKNAVIDMNHMAGPVLPSQINGCKITFENVKIINAENCQSKEVIDNSTGVKVKGEIPESASKISVEVIKDSSKIADIDKSLSSAASETERYKTVAAYDLSLLDSSNVKIQPNGIISISIPLDGSIANKKLAVFYVDDNGKATKMDSTVADGVITFTTTHFSEYVIAEVVPVTNPSGNDGNTPSGNGGTTETPAGENTTSPVNTNGESTTGTASTNRGTTTTTNTAGSTETTTTTAAGTTSGTGSTASTNSTSTDANVVNPKTGDFGKSMLLALIAVIISLVGLVLAVIRRRKRLN